MTTFRLSFTFVIAATVILAGCGDSEPANNTKQSLPANATPSAASEPAAQDVTPVETEAAAVVSNPRYTDTYATVRLDADLSHLSAQQKQLVAKLIDASRIMDDLFWQQAYGDKSLLITQIEDPQEQRFAEINYGPWDRLNNNEPFIAGVDAKPSGANFYPADMTRQEFRASRAEGRTGLYSLLRRNDEGVLINVPYSQAYAAELNLAASMLRDAAELAEHDGFANYLRLRADALVSDDYFASDIAWMDNKTNAIELVYGPIETYEDQLFGQKAAFSSYVLIKDQQWSERLEKYAAFLPELQRGLPVAEKYKREMPGTDADLNAYDVVYYAGDSNAGSKTIAINLPNDERVQLEKGTRRLQLKNAMRAKFDQILMPIADVLIVEDQRQHITFNAFFANTMFHEVAHGLGIKNTLSGDGTVREALRETASALEEGKADILGLYMIQKLHEKGELGDAELMDYYVTFMAGIFRSVRFGASSAHGKANMIRFNFFALRNAFSRDRETGLYRVNPERMSGAITALSKRLLTIQGDGDYSAASSMLNEMGVIRPELQQDLDKVSAAGIPVDIVFEQGKQVLGL